MCTGGVLLSRLPGAAAVFQLWSLVFGGGSVARHAFLVPLIRSAGLCKMSSSVLTAFL